MGNEIGCLREGCARASSTAPNWRGVRLAGLVLLVGCGGSGAPGGSADAGGAAREASGGSAAVSDGGAAVGGASHDGSGGLSHGGDARGGAPQDTSGGLSQGGDALGGAPQDSSGGLSQGGDARGGAPQDGSGGLPQGGDALGGAPQDSSGGLSQGGAGAPSQPTLEPVRVIRGDPIKGGWWDLAVRGVALESYEGKVVTVRMGRPDRAPERLGSGQARVEAGAFELFFPEVWETSLYKQKLVWIDVDDDGSCDPVNDQLFADFRASAASELTVRGSGAHQQFDFFPAPDPAHCAWFNSDWPSQ